MAHVPMSSTLASGLRRGGWLKLDRVEKWTTLRDIQRNIPKLLKLHEQPETSPFFTNSVLSPIVLSTFATCLSFWLRSLQDVHDTLARKKTPYSENFRSGFYLNAKTYPMRHPERLADPYTSGYVSMLTNERGLRFHPENSKFKEVYYPWSKERCEVTDYRVLCGIMQAIALILSGLYIEESVVGFATNNPLLHKICEILFPHLIEAHFLGLNTFDEIEKRNNVDDGEKNTKGSSSSDSWKIKSENSALKYDAVLRNSWVCIPSRKSGQEWTPKAVKAFCNYMIENDASNVFVDDQWPCTELMKAEFERISEHHQKEGGGTDVAMIKPVVFPIQNLISNLPMVIKTPNLSIFIPSSQKEDLNLKKILQRELHEVSVVGINMTALDALFLYPMLNFSDEIGNDFRFKDVDRSVVSRSFLSKASDYAIGGNISLKDRVKISGKQKQAEAEVVEKNTPQKKVKESSKIMHQERLIEFLRQPQFSTLVPVLSSRYLCL